VTVLLNLDAAVVLLTPLYLRIADRHGEDPLALASVPALMASLASTVLPVSNLTNLIVVGQLDIGTADFLVHAAPAAAAAVAVGWFFDGRAFVEPAGAHPAPEPVDERALRIGTPVVVWLLVRFAFGERLGAPAWSVAAVAVAALMILTRRLPWRAVPVEPALPALVVALAVRLVAI
jgi:arsenical pump membrane protein